MDATKHSHRRDVDITGARDNAEHIWIGLGLPDIMKHTLYRDADGVCSSGKRYAVFGAHLDWGAER